MSTIPRKTPTTRRISWGLRRKFYEAAESQIKNGLPVPKVIAEFEARLRRRGHKTAASIFSAIRDDVRDGCDLAEAMAGSLTDLERNVLVAAERGSQEEKTGQLPGAMRLILDSTEMISKMRRAAMMSLFSPAILFASSYLSLAVIGFFVMPALKEAAPVARWHGWGTCLNITMTIFVGWPAPIVLGALTVYFGWTLWALPRWTGTGRTFCDKHLFPFTLYREITGFVWATSYVAQIRGRISELSALEGQIKIARPWLKSRLEATYVGVKYGGLDLPAALRRTGYEFPSPDLIDEIGAYAGFKDFTLKLDAVLNKYGNDLIRAMVFKTSLLSSAITVVMVAIGVIEALGIDSIEKLIGQ